MGPRVTLSGPDAWRSLLVPTPHHSPPSLKLGVYPSSNLTFNEISPPLASLSPTHLLTHFPPALPTKEYNQRKEETKLTIGPPLPNVVLHTLVTVLSSNVTLSSQHQLNIFRRCGEDGREFCVCHDCGFFLFCAKDKGGGEGLARFGFLGNGTVWRFGVGWTEREGTGYAMEILCVESDVVSIPDEVIADLGYSSRCFVLDQIWERPPSDSMLIRPRNCLKPPFFQV